MPKYDFSGWATKNDLKCADGRTIRQNAFAEMDGKTVPLVWSHLHDDPENVLGHALLENRDEGVYCYCTFNNGTKGQAAKEIVQHGDVASLSIYANKLVQKAGDVVHGVIREVSLVIAGANPGAFIDFPVIQHSDGSYADPDEIDEAVISTMENIDLSHGDIDEPEEEEAIEHAEEKEEEPESGKSDPTVQDVINTMTDDQKKVMYYVVGKALEEKESNNNEEDSEVKHNVFEKDTENNSLSHEDMGKIFNDAKRLGSLKEAVLQHMEDGVLAHSDIEPENYVPGSSPSGTYGVDNIDWLFPEARELNNPPKFIERRKEWVSVVMNGVHHTPFSRVKTTFADITMDEARAKGYIKGKKKAEEVFSLLKRSTDPQTVYKKQKLDRDDIIDITDFDVVAWIKGEMRIMLDEELAAAYLVGDGRGSAEDDKISPDHIRPIFSDADLFTIKVKVTEGDTDDDTTKNFIRAAVKARKDYRGGGNLVMFTSEDLLSDALLLEDGIGHTLYADEAALARKMRVRRIVTVPDDILARADVEPEGANPGIKAMALIVDLNDYNVGADKGGAVAMFDDFDIDYNQQKYLIETRCSGALTAPYSAIAMYKEVEEEPTSL